MITQDVERIWQKARSDEDKKKVEKGNEEI